MSSSHSKIRKDIPENDNLSSISTQPQPEPTVRTPLRQPRPVLPEQLGIKVLFNPAINEPTMDVIAVHGIGANPDYTWTTSSVNWLQHPDMLPCSLPHARILRFVYKSQWYEDDAITQRLSIVAESLLFELRTERMECAQRPLVFIGHCFGGLVIQKALNIAKLHDHNWSNIFNSVTGVVFMGTPHRGTGKITSKGLVYAAIASDPSLHVDDTILKVLESGNEVLMDVLHEFVSLCNSPAVNLSLCCFFEQRSSKVGKVIGNEFLEEFVVDEMSGCIDGYPNPNDGNYKRVRDEILRMVTEAPEKIMIRRQAAGPDANKRQTLDNLFHREYEATLQRFKDSLSFPEITSRQERIPDAHLGTCRWIFGPPDRNTCEGSGSHNDALESNRNIIQNDDATRMSTNMHYNEGQPWSDFPKWLETDQGIYWINGKAGSGKSTLMNYIRTREHQTRDMLTRWAKSSKLIVAHFYFWDQGSSLQKSSEGLLRSLLYQIATRRQDLIPTMVYRRADSTNRSFQGAQINEWTEKRLLHTLLECLKNLPSTISVCFFIDGLDEFVGSRDTLIEMVRSMSRMPQVKVCLSSRPEQIFSQEFQGSPQLALHDFNRQDIAKAANDRLRPTLSQTFPNDEKTIDSLIQDLVQDALGVFIWADFVISDLQTGIRNADSLRELRSRLHDMPDSLEGLLKHMLSMLDKRYLKEAANYFYVLIRLCEDDEAGIPCVLAHFACMEEIPWNQILKNNTAYFTSSEFFTLCQRVETRILTRCAGLVEVDKVITNSTGIWAFSDPHLDDLEELQWSEILNGGYHWREVRFIHKAVAEFIPRHFQEILQELGWCSATSFRYLRGPIGAMRILPALFLDSNVPAKIRTRFDSEDTIRISMVCYITFAMDHLANGISLDPEFLSDHALADSVVKMVEFAYQVICDANTKLSDQAGPWNQSRLNLYVNSWNWCAHYFPFIDCVGFAAFFGNRAFVSHYVKSHSCSMQEINYLLTCTISGLARWNLVGVHVASLNTLEVLLSYSVDPNAARLITKDIDTERNTSYQYEESAWAMFLCVFKYEQISTRLKSCLTPIETMLFVNKDPNAFTAFYPLWFRICNLFWSQGADFNTSIFRTFQAHGKNFRFLVEETPLSFLKHKFTSEHSRVNSLETTRLWKEIASIFQSRDAREQIRYRLLKIKFASRHPAKWYEINETQSQRLMEKQGLLCTCTNKEPESAAQCPLIRLADDLTELDMTRSGTLVLRSSFQSALAETYWKDSESEPNSTKA